MNAETPVVTPPEQKNSSELKRKLDHIFVATGILLFFTSLIINYNVIKNIYSKKQQ